MKKLIFGICIIGVGILCFYIWYPSDKPFKLSDNFKKEIPEAKKVSDYLKKDYPNGVAFAYFGDRGLEMYYSPQQKGEETTSLMITDVYVKTTSGKKILLPEGTPIYGKLGLPYQKKNPDYSIYMKGSYSEEEEYNYFVKINWDKIWMFVEGKGYCNVPIKAHTMNAGYYNSIEDLNNGAVAEPLTFEGVSVTNQLIYIVFDALLKLQCLELD
ncbi:hypothetical protein BKH41_08785 [Helicobacter sp. 12S02232-10]|uniref:hypothetical protein n=1 Tax=Helicobacter sp. 12S02232-10 TaxID=1476197 RepID=UPI000BA7BF81|nr:hypothetical protein [Helicobacter sp. 12S02232-10]PAF46590.1 hypothetical protein BKH41_08785 [Helicobacter sp. 12S02232-10]